MFYCLLKYYRIIVQYTGGVCFLTFLPAVHPPLHLWVSCRVISWCHHSQTFHPLPSVLCLLHQLLDGSPQAYPSWPSSSEKLVCWLSHEAPASNFYWMDGRGPSPVTLHSPARSEYLNSWLLWPTPRHCLLPVFSWSEERDVWPKGIWRSICPDSRSFQLLRQLPQHLIMPPSGALVLTSEPLGEVSGTREGVIYCPHKEAEPLLWSSPDICTGYYPVNGVLPAGLCSLFALGNSHDEVTVLFNSWVLFHHHGLPLLSCGFGPKLDWLSPAQPCSAVLDSSHDLLML